MGLIEFLESLGYLDLVLIAIVDAELALELAIECSTEGVRNLLFNYYQHLHESIS
jgi:hypothetical protein